VPGPFSVQRVTHVGIKKDARGGVVPYPVFFATELLLVDRTPTTGFFAATAVDVCGALLLFRGCFWREEFFFVMVLGSLKSLFSSMCKRRYIKIATPISASPCSKDTTFTNSIPRTATKPKIGMGRPEAANFSRSFTFLLRALRVVSCYSGMSLTALSKAEWKCPLQL
jgi:hypothetical protein